MAKCRVIEALEVEMKALSPALLIDPPAPLPPQGSCSVLQTFFMRQHMGPQRDGKKLDPTVY